MLPAHRGPQARRRAARPLRRRGAAATAESAVGLGRLAALLGIVLRGAKALEPIRERTRRITLPDVREERRVRAIERYRAFIDSASDGIVVLDGAGAVLYMNRAAEEVTGYARDGLAGKRSPRSCPRRPRQLSGSSAPSRASPSTTSTSIW